MATSKATKAAKPVVPSLRTPRTIAADLVELHEKADKSFVPADVKAAARLAAEFAQSTAAVLEAAGLMPDEPAED